ncbi:response regulator [Eubacteriales bacterium OttesenSCG-928-N13]|nr:response regulator [Eubacteriales bacterium OttesenSCG-928-N13]
MIQTNDNLNKKRERHVFRAVPAEYRDQFDNYRLDTNITRMRVFAIYVIILQIALNVINIVKPASGESSNIMVYIMLSMGTLLVGIIYFILLTLVKKNKIKRKPIKVFLTHSLIYIYTAIQLTFCTLNIISNGGINSYIIAILIIGLFPVLRPSQSLVSILGSLAYVVVAMYMNRFVSTIWDSILITDLWTNMIIITGLVVCVSIFIYNIYVDNFINSMKLLDNNRHLEEIVEQRTHALSEQTQAAQVANMAKSEFLARMSHEIRTPLNAIIGMTQIALKSSSEPKTIRSMEEVSTASTHLLDILNDVLDMSKIESGKFEMTNESFQLRGAMDEVSNIISSRCKERHITYKTNGQDLPQVFVDGDRLRLKQVLINLLGNAVKFTPEHGQIECMVNITHQDDARVRLHFVVQDNGIGMSPSQIAHLFTAFEQTDRSIASRYGGTGLGLAISQSLVERMGGHIEAESEKGYGSKFFFDVEFELAEQQHGKIAVAQDGTVPDLSGKRVLVVEDVEINRIILIELLAETNLSIDEAVDGVQAVEMFTKSGIGSYDMILMDVQMPNMNGYDATRRIRQLKREDAASTPIIALTANAYREDVENALEAGMDGHLAKPVDLDALMNILREKLVK